MRAFRLTCAMSICAAALAACDAPTAPPNNADTPESAATAQNTGTNMTTTTTASGLQFADTVVGTGASPTTGQTCVMHYTGWLWVNGAKGAKFDSSVDRGQAFEFPIGTGRVIKGWDEGRRYALTRKSAETQSPRTFSFLRASRLEL